MLLGLSASSSISLFHGRPERNLMIYINPDRQSYHPRRNKWTDGQIQRQDD